MYELIQAPRRISSTIDSYQQYQPVPDQSNNYDDSSNITIADTDISVKPEKYSKYNSRTLVLVGICFSAVLFGIAFLGSYFTKSNVDLQVHLQISYIDLRTYIHTHIHIYL